MTLTLSNIGGGKKKARKRVGRGCGSGHGTYSCRGLKGQRSRSGGKKGLKRKGFKRILQTLPKYKGMLRRFPSNQVVPISLLEKHFDAGTQINPGLLFEKKLIAKLDAPVKILADKEITKAFEVFGIRISGKALATLEKAGGKVVGGDDTSKETK